MVNGVQQSPIEGTSMLYTFNEPRRPERHDLQYFEMFGNRGHLPPGLERGHQAPDALGHGRRGVPALRRRRLGALRRLGTTSARRATSPRSSRSCWRSCSGLWLDRGHQVQRAAHRRPHRRATRTLDGRAAATLLRGTSQLFFPGMGRLSENSVVSIKNRSYSVTAEVEIPDGGAHGVVIAQGGRFGGWSLWVREGRLRLHLQRPRPSTSSPSRRRPPCPPGGTRCGWSSRTTAVVWPRAVT